MIDKKDWINLLLDFYGELLTEKQKMIMEYYFQEDLSLNEIAEIQSTTRAAVYDIIHRSQKILEDYEAKLNLYKKYQQRQHLYQELSKLNIDKVNDILKKVLETE